MAKFVEELSKAVQLGKDHEVAILLKKGADPNKADRRGNIPLNWACQEGYLKIVKRLIKGGAKVDDHGRNGFFPLIIATGEGRKQIVRHLLRVGAQVDHKCKPDGCTALNRAAAWNRISIAQDLVKAGAHVNSRDNHGRTPLFFAVLYGHHGMVKFLIRCGANVDLSFQDPEGTKTVAQLAKSTRDPRIVKLLNANKTKG